MPHLPLKSLRRPFVSILVLGVAAAFPCFAQAPASPTAPTASEDPAVIDQAFVGSCVSLGRHAATVQLARKDDTPVRYYLRGRLGASVKESRTTTDWPAPTSRR